MSISCSYSHTRGRVQLGYSLTELLVSMGLVALLMSIALPSYRSHVLKSRRMEAFSQLLSVQMAQERLRGWRNAYAEALSDPDLAHPGVSPSGHYRLHLARQTTESYTVSATVSPQGAQAKDLDCQELQLHVDGGQFVRRAFGRSGQDTTRQCWPT